MTQHFQEKCNTSQDTLAAFWLAIYTTMAFAFSENGAIQKCIAECKDFKTPPSTCRQEKRNILKTARTLKIADNCHAQVVLVTCTDG